MPRYYLVSLYDPETKTHAPSYWMTDDGEKWRHILKGVLKPKHPEDIIKETVDADKPQQLDWSKTPIVAPESTAGWLSSTGEFHGCPVNHHDKYAYYVLGMEVSEMNERGWARVRSTKYFECEKPLTEEQKSWLVHQGRKFHDTF